MVEEILLFDKVCTIYCNDLMYSNKQVWGSDEDPDKTALEQSWLGSTLFANLSA